MAVLQVHPGRLGGRGPAGPLARREKLVFPSPAGRLPFTWPRPPARPGPPREVKAFARGGMRLPVPAASIIGERSAHVCCPGFPCLCGLRECADSYTLDWLTPIIHGHCRDGCFLGLSWAAVLWNWLHRRVSWFLFPGRERLRHGGLVEMGNNEPIL